MQVWRARVRAGVVQMQVVFVEAQRGCVVRVVVKQVAWRWLVGGVLCRGGLMMFEEMGGIEGGTVYKQVTGCTEVMYEEIVCEDLMVYGKAVAWRRVKVLVKAMVCMKK